MHVWNGKLDHGQINEYDCDLAVFVNLCQMLWVFAIFGCSLLTYVFLVNLSLVLF